MSRGHDQVRLELLREKRNLVENRATDPHLTATGATMFLGQFP